MYRKRKQVQAKYRELIGLNVSAKYNEAAFYSVGATGARVHGPPTGLNCSLILMLTQKAYVIMSNIYPYWSKSWNAMQCIILLDPARILQSLHLQFVTRVSQAKMTPPWHLQDDGGDMTLNTQSNTVQQPDKGSNFVPRFCLSPIKIPGPHLKWRRASPQGVKACFTPQCTTNRHSCSGELCTWADC